MKRVFAADFETTVYEGQESTEVWAAGIVELFESNDTYNLFQNLDDFIKYLKSLKCNALVYFHNLKFDGSFLLDYFMRHKKYKMGCYNPRGDYKSFKWKADKELQTNEYSYTISELGMWYTFKVRLGRCIIEFRDSLKLLPFSLDEICKAFDTPHKKLKMEYEGIRFANCYIKPEEKKYIRNDVLALKEALEITFNEGHRGLTIGSCCMKEYKRIVRDCNYGGDNDKFNYLFPNLYEMPLRKEIFGSSNVDEYIRKSYRGGWCYYDPECSEQVVTNGFTADVNSLYPSMMHSMSGNRYPIGVPHMFTGSVPELSEDKYYFIRIRCSFRIKDGYLPFIQNKSSYLYKSNENLTTSDIWDASEGVYYDTLVDGDGNEKPVTMELTLTQVEHKLFLKHYEVYNYEELDGCWFNTEIGIFDDYIDKYKHIKMTSKGAKRTLAKLFLNNLYGKIATNIDSSFKVAYLKDDGSIGFKLVLDQSKKPVHIACASAITGYTRRFTITAAQLNYRVDGMRGFRYADTDSIHCDIPVDMVKGIEVDDNEFCKWKIESCWSEAIFVRQKTYVEKVTHEDMNPVGEHYSVKCAGMPKRAQKILQILLDGKELTQEELTDYNFNKEETEFIFKDGEIRKFNITDFKVGLEVPGSLKSRRIKGGIVLKNDKYKMR